MPDLNLECRGCGMENAGRRAEASQVCGFETVLSRTVSSYFCANPSSALRRASTIVMSSAWGTSSANVSTAAHRLRLSSWMGSFRWDRMKSSILSQPNCSPSRLPYSKMPSLIKAKISPGYISIGGGAIMGGWARIPSGTVEAPSHFTLSSPA